MTAAEFLSEIVSEADRTGYVSGEGIKALASSKIMIAAKDEIGCCAMLTFLLDHSDKRIKQGQIKGRSPECEAQCQRARRFLKGEL